jgi:hypothetical protein
VPPEIATKAVNVPPGKVFEDKRKVPLPVTVPKLCPVLLDKSSIPPSRISRDCDCLLLLAVTSLPFNITALVVPVGVKEVVLTHNVPDGSVVHVDADNQSPD